MKIRAEDVLTLWAPKANALQLGTGSQSRWHLNEDDEDTQESTAFRCLQTQFHRPLLYRAPSKIHFFIDQNSF